MDKKLFKSILWIITYAVLLVLVLVKFDALGDLLMRLLGLFQPLYLGFAIAFVLNRPCRAFGRLYDRGLGRTRAAGLSHPLAVATSYLMLLLVFSGLFSFVLPKLAESIQIFVNSLGGYVANLQSWVDALVTRFHLDALEMVDFSALDDAVKKLLNGALDILSNAAPAVVAFTGNIISMLVTLVLAVVFSIYMLAGQDKLLAHCRKALKAYLPSRPAGVVLNVVHLTAETFSRFVTGQLIEACILGGLTAAGMLFIQADYAPLIGVIIGASALVPVAGAYMGSILAAFLLVMVSPVKALIFLVFLLILQQIEGNVIYPRVVGSSIGLPGIWVLTAVTIGGGLFGLPGILVSVPIASVAYALLRRDVRRRLGETEE